ncbi:hypothetical protein [Tropicimonas sp. IMCC6043]|nr:hypothetical protein [Tropicimonas sp. IMCC6043]
MLKEHALFRPMIVEGRSSKMRAKFDRENQLCPEQTLRNRIKAARLWMR